MNKKEHTEREYKWEAFDRNDFFVFLSALKNSVKIISSEDKLLEDFYFDSPDKYFSSSKTSCRIRKEKNSFTLTLKKNSPLENGLASREEKETRLKAHDLKAALKEAQGILGKKLLQVFSFNNERTVYRVKSEFAAEVCFDAFTINIKQGKLAMKEIEMEFKSGDINAFHRAARQLTDGAGLKFAEVSKVKTALAALEFYK